jgi:hypothetical protein
MQAIPAEYGFPIRVEPARPFGAAILLLVGGSIACVGLLFLGLASASVFFGCFGRGTCAGGAETILAIFWSLFALVTVTAVTAVVSGFILLRGTRHHQLLGGVTLGLSGGSLVALFVAYPWAFWAILLILGGWSLLLIFVGGVIAFRWTPPRSYLPPPPPGYWPSS